MGCGQDDLKLLLDVPAPHDGRVLFNAELQHLRFIGIMMTALQ